MVVLEPHDSRYGNLVSTLLCMLDTPPIVSYCGVKWLTLVHSSLINQSMWSKNHETPGVIFQNRNGADV